MTDLLGWSHLRDQVEILMDATSCDAQPAVEALVEIAGCLYAAQHMGTDPSQGDLTIITEVLDAIETFSHPLAARFSKPAVHMQSKPRHRAPDQSPLQRSWKPVAMMWTAPVVEPSSAWALWAVVTGNAQSWIRQVRYESPDHSARIVVDSLASADALVGPGSFNDVLSRAESEGIHRIDFSWRCAIEAECSALRNERTALSFPCGLGTESSVWLVSPPELSEHSLDRTQPRVGQEPAGWFKYD